MLIKKIRNVRTPTRGTEFSAGIDFYIPYCFHAANINPFESLLIPSGIICDIPNNYALIAFNKSGIVTKKQLIAGACVIDCDYTGEIHLHLINISNNVVTVVPGEKILQFLLMPVYLDNIIVDQDYVIKDTLRGANGFGSTT